MINFLASYNTFPPLTSQDAGFDARVDNEGGAHTGLSHSRSIRKWRNTFVFSLVFAIPTLLFAFMPITWPVIVPGLTVKEVLLFTLSSIIQVNSHISIKRMSQTQVLKVCAFVYRSSEGTSSMWLHTNPCVTVLLTWRYSSPWQPLSPTSTQ